MNPKQVKQYTDEKECDFAIGVPGIGRFRVNLYQQRGSLCFAMRAIPYNTRTIIKTPPPVTPDPKRPNKKPAEIFIPRDTVRVRMVGRTVDVQAFTRFMRSLEDSPFIEGVLMERTEALVESGKAITQFTLQVTYSRPDTLMLKRAPIVFNQR